MAETVTSLFGGHTLGAGVVFEALSLAEQQELRQADLVDLIRQFPAAPGPGLLGCAGPAPPAIRGPPCTWPAAPGIGRSPQASTTISTRRGKAGGRRCRWVRRVRQLPLSVPVVLCRQRAADQPGRPDRGWIAAGRGLQRSFVPGIGHRLRRGHRVQAPAAPNRLDQLRRRKTPGPAAPVRSILSQPRRCDVQQHTRGAVFRRKSFAFCSAFAGSSMRV